MKEDNQLTFLEGNFAVCHQGPWPPKQQSVQNEKNNTCIYLMKSWKTTNSTLISCELKEHLVFNFLGRTCSNVLANVPLKREENLIAK